MNNNEKYLHLVNLVRLKYNLRIKDSFSIIRQSKKNYYRIRNSEKLVSEEEIKNLKKDLHYYVLSKDGFTNDNEDFIKFIINY